MSNTAREKDSKRSCVTELLLEVEVVHVVAEAQADAVEVGVLLKRLRDALLVVLIR